MTYAQAELLVKVDPEIRSSSLPSGVQPPEGKKKGKCDKLASDIRLDISDLLMGTVPVYRDVYGGGTYSALTIDS